MPQPTLVKPANNNKCPACKGTGTVHSGSKREPEYEPGDCPECNGTGKARIEPDRERCSACGSDEVRYLAIKSREPHGEPTRDEGWKCLDCGATVMDTPSPIVSRTSDDLIEELMRSIYLARSLDPAFRMGVALAGVPEKREVA